MGRTPVSGSVPSHGLSTLGAVSETERVRWEARYRDQGRRLTEPTGFVVEAVSRIEPIGTALDLAGGAGRNAIWLAAHGWTVTLVDVSPTALDLASIAAAEAGVELETQAVDLDDAAPVGGPWDLVVIAHYLNRELLERVATMVRPGGHLVVTHPTIHNLERNERPPKDHLLQPGELPGLLAGLHVVAQFEGWTPEDRHEAQIVARRPG